MTVLFRPLLHINALLDSFAPWLAFLLLRFLIGWEFLDSGLEKLQGENWFMDIQDQFPFPFNIISPEVSWIMATWFELIGGVALMAGFGTRFFAMSLIILTVVATSAVHWPADLMMFSDIIKGYSITDHGYGNFKLPLLFIAMLLPLLFMGAGKLSLDFILLRFVINRTAISCKDQFPEIQRTQ